jgi:PAS domain S-box-containing protein
MNKKPSQQPSLDEQHYRILVDSIKDYAIFMMDHEGRVMSWNAGAQKIKGYASAEIIGQSFECFYTNKDRADGKPAAILKKAAADGYVEDEGWRVRKNGTCFWANVVISAIRDQKGRLQGFAKITRDLTVRKHLQDELTQRVVQLEILNKELEMFSYSISHDLRAPLRGIDGFSRILLETQANRLDAEGIQHLNRVRASAKRMGALIDDLLSLSRLTRMEMRWQTIDLSHVAQGIIQELQQNEPDRNVQCTIQPGLAVQGDPTLLRAVLENLLGNAWKFTGRKANAAVELGSRVNDGEVAYFVRDNGAGFEMAHVGNLFGPFQRLHSTEEFPGNGIGLASAQRIIHRHGGRIWAEGLVDQGATFYFTLGARPKGESA